MLYHNTKMQMVASTSDFLKHTFLCNRSGNQVISYTLVSDQEGGALQGSHQHFVKVPGNRIDSNQEQTGTVSMFSVIIKSCLFINV